MKGMHCFIVMVFYLPLILMGCAGSRRFENVEKKLVHGFADEAFAAVKAEFVNNIANREEIGAACAVYYDGKKVVDVWGGYRDKKRKHPWTEHTMVRSWSTAKGIGALCLGILHSRGLLDYNERIAHYWPSFAKLGKKNITVRQLLSQQAGLCLLSHDGSRKYHINDLKNHDTLSRILEDMQPIWKPGTRYGYHGASEGLFIGELIRRIDPEGRSIGRFFREEIAEPLGVNYYIGLPEDIPDSCLAETVMAGFFVALSQMGKMPPRLRKAVFSGKSIFMRSMKEVKGMKINDRKYLSFEDPGGNGIGEPRAVAVIYNEVLSGGEKIGLSPATIAEFEKPATYPPGQLLDTVMGIIMPTSLGFMKPDSGSAFYTTSKRAYGFFGANGSMGFADPEKKMAFSYCGNYNGYDMSEDEDRVVKVVYDCIKNLEEKK